MKKFYRAKLLSVGLLTLLLWLTGPAWAGATAADSYLAAAQKAYKESDQKLARLLFNKAILVNPDRPEVFLGSAKAWARGGQFQQALDDAEEGCRLAKSLNDPAAIEALCLLAYIAYLTGNEASARGYLDEARRIFPASAQLYYARAVFYEESGDLERALADYSQAIKLLKKTPKNERPDAVMNNFADCANRLPLDRKGAALYLGRGMAHSKAGNFVEARRDLKRAVSMNREFLRYLPEGIAR